jgi:SNF2 family DNA or RNA helicase
VDVGDLGEQELSKILSAYSQKKKYYRLKNGQFVMLGEGGLYTVMNLADELGISRKELLSGHLKLPSYRAIYLDHALKEGSGVAYYREQLFRAVVRGIKSVEDSSDTVPESMKEVLREYQKTGFRWLKTLDSCGFGGILADDMGLGKTIQAIALLEDTYSRGDCAPSLIVCPASLIYNWECEIRRFAPDRKVLVIAGNGSQREELIEKLAKEPKTYEIAITSYDLLKRDASLYEKLDFRFQMIDEAQYIKNAATQSAKAVKSIHAQTKFAFTGTPVENRLGELWSIFDFLMPGFLFGSQYFRKEYEAPIVKDGDEKRLERLRRLIGPFVLRRTKKDVLKELPDKLERVVYSGFEEEQREIYSANALMLKKKLESGSFGTDGSAKLQILAELTRLRQLCCDPRLCYGNYKGGSAKLETCIDLIHRGVEGEHKMLLFSQFTSMLELIEERLKKENVAYLKLTGATSKEERLELVARFQKEEVPVFLISLKAGGTGLNLTAADIVIHYDPWWNVAAQNQATDRTHRIGQEKQVTVYKLIAKNTIEENILKLQEMKRELADQVVTEENMSLSSLSREDLLEMLQEI